MPGPGMRGPLDRDWDRERMDRGLPGSGIMDRIPPSGQSRGPPDRDWDREHAGDGSGIDFGPSGPGMIDRMPPSGPPRGPPDGDWDHEHVEGGSGMDRGPSGPGMMDRMQPSRSSRGPPDRDWDRDHVEGGGGMDRGPSGPGMFDRMPLHGPLRGPFDRDRDWENVGGVAGMDRRQSGSGTGPSMIDRMPPSGPLRGPHDRDWEPDDKGSGNGPLSDRMMPRGVSNIGIPNERGEPTWHAPPEEDQFGRQRPPQHFVGFNRSQFLGAGSGDPGGGGSGSHNSLLLSGRFVPGVFNGLGGIPDREDSSDFIQQQHDSRGSPKGDTGWGNIAQRFEQTASSQIAISANQPAVWLAIVGLGTTTMTTTTNRGSDPDVSDTVPLLLCGCVDARHVLTVLGTTAYVLPPTIERA